MVLEPGLLEGNGEAGHVEVVRMTPWHAPLLKQIFHYLRTIHCRCPNERLYRSQSFGQQMTAMTHITLTTDLSGREHAVVLPNVDWSTFCKSICLVEGVHLKGSHNLFSLTLSWWLVKINIASRIDKAKLLHHLLHFNLITVGHTPILRLVFSKCLTHWLFVCLSCLQRHCLAFRLQSHLPRKAHGVWVGWVGLDYGHWFNERLIVFAGGM